MNKAQLDALAGILLDSYFETAGYSLDFTTRHGQPPTAMAKAHHLRSVAQARINDDDRFMLGGEYAEFGRVQIADLRPEGRTYLLRSSSAISIERAKRETGLFDSGKYLVSELILLVTLFHKEGLDLSVVGARRTAGRMKVEATGDPLFVATWPYTTPTDPNGRFEQQPSDAFDELGDPHLGESAVG